MEESSFKFDNAMKRHYSVRYYCPNCEREDWERDMAGAISQNTIRAAGLDVEKKRYFLAFY